MCSSINCTSKYSLIKISLFDFEFKIISIVLQTNAVIDFFYKYYNLLSILIFQNESVLRIGK